jgi:hypothetical protein
VLTVTWFIIKNLLLGLCGLRFERSGHKVLDVWQRDAGKDREGRVFIMGINETEFTGVRHNNIIFWW